MRTREIRAQYDAETVTVYQAYPPEIALPTAAAGNFPAWYKRDRMTWIKPSFLWMMYRSGWATKPGQEHVLALRIRRTGFEWALRHSALSHYDSRVHSSQEAFRDSLRMPVRIRWDPERDLHLHALPHRAIQIGLSGEAVHSFVDEWIAGVTDVTGLAQQVHEHVRQRDLLAAQELLPDETAYTLSADLAAVIGADA